MFGIFLCSYVSAKLPGDCRSISFNYFYLDLGKKMMILVISLFKTKLISKGYIVRLTNGELKTKPVSF